MWFGQPSSTKLPLFLEIEDTLIGRLRPRRGFSTMINLQYWRRVLLAGFAVQVSLVLLVIIAAAIAARFRPRETSFNVEVQTERLDLTISTVTPFQWPFEEVELVEGVGEPLTLPEKHRFVTDRTPRQGVD
jgi:hypothetical protein